MSNDWRVIGVDPAPSKKSVAYSDGGFTPLEPASVPRFIEQVVTNNSRTLIAWDAPLSFSATNFYDRVVDRAARDWIDDHVLQEHFTKKAINAVPFARLSHWVISCQALGLPFGRPPPNFRLALTPTAPGPSDIGPLVIEVHPAVALAALWLDHGCPFPIPRYKTTGREGKQAREDIASALGRTLDLPSLALDSDDNLDAYIAYMLGEMFISGTACWIGDPVRGGYVMPCGNATTELIARIANAS